VRLLQQVPAAGLPASAAFGMIADGSEDRRQKFNGSDPAYRGSVDMEAPPRSLVGNSNVGALRTDGALF